LQYLDSNSISIINTTTIEINDTPNSMENNSTGNEPDNTTIILTLNEAVNDEEIISNEGKN
jgi:hypothetical protein